MTMCGQEKRLRPRCTQYVWKLMDPRRSIDPMSSIINFFCFFHVLISYIPIRYPFYYRERGVDGYCRLRSARSYIKNHRNFENWIKESIYVAIYVSLSYIFVVRGEWDTKTDNMNVIDDYLSWNEKLRRILGWKPLLCVNKCVAMFYQRLGNGLSKIFDYIYKQNRVLLWRYKLCQNTWFGADKSCEVINGSQLTRIWFGS